MSHVCIMRRVFWGRDRCRYTVDRYTAFLLPTYCMSRNGAFPHQRPQSRLHTRLQVAQGLLTPCCWAPRGPYLGIFHATHVPRAPTHPPTRQVLRLCEAHRLHSASAYVYNRLHDFRRPLLDLLGAVALQPAADAAAAAAAGAGALPPAANSAGMKLLVYLR